MAIFNSYVELPKGILGIQEKMAISFDYHGDKRGFTNNNWDFLGRYTAIGIMG